VACALVMTPEARASPHDLCRRDRASAIRIPQIFDPRRTAVLPAAGDKAGTWEAWYRRAIPRAGQRYEDSLKQEDTR
jgi:hypothetical protein